jgi:hypothetical protein
MCETLNYKFNFLFTFYILHKVSVYFCVMLQKLGMHLKTWGWLHKHTCCHKVFVVRLGVAKGYYYVNLIS